MALVMPGGWIDRDDYAIKRYAEIESIRKLDPDRAEVLKNELEEELDSPADIDNPTQLIKIENQTCSTCGHEGDYERFCWNCPVVVIKGRGNWVPKNVINLEGK